MAKAAFDHVILYEDIVENPGLALKTLFDLLNIDHKHISCALGALKKDSQNEQGFVHKRKIYHLGPKEIKQTHEIFEQFKLVGFSLDMNITKFRDLIK